MLTPQQKAKIQQKEAAMAPALKRDPTIDYCHGWFFVTINTRQKVPVLSVIDGTPSLPDGHPDAPHCRYTQLGRGVLEAWARNATIYTDVEVDICEAMPEHFHGLIHLLPGNRRHLGQIIKGFMVGCSHAYWDILALPWRDMGYTKGERTPQYEDRDHTLSRRGPALFVHGYNDMVPITPEQVEVKRAYIRDQARKRLIQGDRHACFRKYRHRHSPNWTAATVLQAIAADPCLCHEAANLEVAMLDTLAHLNADAGTSATTTYTLPSGRNVSLPTIGLDLIGNTQLLHAQEMVPLVCHRADAPLFERQRTAVMEAARAGAIVVSAFISEHERDIRQQLLAELLPFVEIVDNGFGDKYKGSGTAFYALAENRLLQVSPWSHLYHRDTPIDRAMCMVMNRLSILIARRKDDWWKVPDR